MPESKQLNILLFGAGAALVLFWLSKQAAEKTIKAVDTWTKEATQPTGEALSDLTARLNGWSAVELQPLMIRDIYLTENRALTPDAERVLWKWSNNHPLLTELFGFKGGVLKPRYYSLINVKLTKENLHV